MLLYMVEGCRKAPNTVIRRVLGVNECNKVNNLETRITNYFSNNPNTVYGQTAPPRGHNSNVTYAESKHELTHISK